MVTRKPLHLPYLALVLSGFLIARCSVVQPAPTDALQPPPKAVTPTPTVFLPPTEISGGDIWLSPSLPAAFAETWQDPDLQERGFYLIDEREAADIEVIPAGEAQLTTWIYALVAPFPTTIDGITWETLQSLWSGPEGLEPILVSSDTLVMLEPLLGPAGENVLIAPAEKLSELTWQLRPAFAIIPFEALEPRWKVLAIEGQSPIQREFEISAYPLRVMIGIEGPPDAPEILTQLLDIPISNRDADQMTILVMTGVTALTRATAWQMDRRGINFPALKIGYWLQEADLTHISHEVAFTPDCPPPDPAQVGLRFCADPDHIELLELVGTDIIELTGNHVRDYGSDALDYTLGEYRKRGWGTFGGGVDLEAAFEPLLIEHNGNQFAFLGCNQAGPKYAWATEDSPGSTPCETDLLFAQVQQLAASGYQVIFSYQWGEGSVVLEPQRKAFEAAVNAGALIVNGSQAHQPLGMAFHQDGFLHFGLGNLFFDQMQTIALRSEVIDRHIFYEGRYISTELLTAMLESYAQPRPMTLEERSAFLGELFDDSGW